MIAANRELHESVLDDIRHGRIKELLEKIDSHPELLTTSIDSWRTMLHYAARDGQAAVITALLKLGMDPNIPDNEMTRMTPLHTAAAHGFLEGVDLLLAAGADINRLDAFGDTPLFLSISHPRYYSVDILPSSPETAGRLDETFLLLLRNGAVIDAPYRLCRYAAWYGQVGSVDFLLRNVFEQYPEMPPDRTRDVEWHHGILQLLADESMFEYYPEFAHQNQSILYAAVCSGKIDLVRSLIAFGATGLAGKDGRESLLRAVRDNHLDIAVVLREAGAPTDPHLHGAKPGARLHMWNPGGLQQDCGGRTATTRR